MMVEAQIEEKRKKAFAIPSSQESREALSEFLENSKTNPMLKPSELAQQELDRVLYKLSLRGYNTKF